MFIGDCKLSEPNDKGYQFGINDGLTKWAHDEQLNYGNTMPSIKITVLEVWKDGEFETFLLIDDKTGQPIDEVKGYEACAAKIDMYKLKEKNK